MDAHLLPKTEAAGFTAEIAFFITNFMKEHLRRL
jgi:hypothetical protein